MVAGSIGRQLDLGCGARVSYDGIGPAELARRVRAPSCLSLAKVTSTLDIIHELAGEGAPAGTVVIADEQVAGRGRRGQRWRSPPSTGVWLGYLMRPGRGLDGGVLAIRVGLVLAEMLGEMGAEAQVKWPNDVLVGRRKVAGVLCEVRWMRDRVEWIALGIGLNVHGRLPDEIAHQAVALDEMLPDVTRIGVLERLVPKLHSLSQAPHLDEGELALFRRYDWLAGKRLREPVGGLACGVDRDGSLVVETAHGVERVRGGSVVAA